MHCPETQGKDWQLHTNILIIIKQLIHNNVQVIVINRNVTIIINFVVNLWIFYFCVECIASFKSFNKCFAWFWATLLRDKMTFDEIPSPNEMRIDCDSRVMYIWLWSMTSNTCVREMGHHVVMETEADIPKCQFLFWVRGVQQASTAASTCVCVFVIA